MGRVVPFRGQAARDGSSPLGPVAPWDVSFVASGIMRAAHGEIRMEARVTMSQRTDGAWIVTIKECGTVTPHLLVLAPHVPTGESWELFLAALFMRLPPLASQVRE